MKRNKLERLLFIALDDATKQDLTISSQKLIQSRITALTTLIESDQTVTQLKSHIERLEGEVARLAEENVRLAQSSQTKPSETIAGIDEVLERHAAQNATRGK